jgi:ribonuclease BN (tRNA processing enzyme)
MKVEFVGVGEAFDETLPNNSQVLEWNGYRLLIDCGYAVPHALWKKHPDPEYLDAVYISHPHADHYFGLPSYLVRLAEDGRKRMIEVFCPSGVKAAVSEMIECGYRGILGKISLSMRIREVKQGELLELAGARLEFAQSAHPVRNFAIAISHDDRKYAYSGDGNFTPGTSALYRNCALLAHEAYCLGPPFHGHASIGEVIAMAERAEVKTLALTHLRRDIRKNRRAEIDALIAQSTIKVMIPEPGDVFEL